MSRFRRRLMGLAALGQAAADDFVRVEYIENTSTAYIDTHIIPDAQTGLKTKAYFTDTRDVYFVGLKNDGGNTRWGIGHNPNGFYYGYGTYQTSKRLADTKGEFYLNYKNDKKFITIDLDDSSTLTSNLPNLSFTPKFGIRIFGGAAVGGANTIVKSRIYYLQITQGSEIIRDFIPMYQISTDTYGLWDRVEKKFYTSPNGAKFVGGREIIYDAEIEYLEKGSGTSPFIDLGTSADAIFEITAQATRTINSSMTLITRHSQSNGGNWFGVPVYKNRCWGLGTTSGTFSNVSSLKKTNITVDFTVNPVVGTINGKTFSRSRGTTNMTWHLFGTTYPFIGRLYALKAYIEDKLTFDLIPVRVGNVGYMYDKVSNKLFGNNGSGSFILGQDTIVYDKI